MVFDWIETHIWITKAYAAAVMGIGAAVAAIVPDQAVAFVAAIALMVLGWVGTTMFRTAQTLSRVSQRLDDMDRRLESVETRQWDDHAHTV